MQQRTFNKGGFPFGKSSISVELKKSAWIEPPVDDHLFEGCFCCQSDQILSIICRGISNWYWAKDECGVLRDEAGTMSSLAENVGPGAQPGSAEEGQEPARSLRPL